MTASPGSPRRRLGAWIAVALAVLIGATAGTLLTLAAKGVLGGTGNATTAGRTPPVSTATPPPAPSPPAGSPTASPAATPTPTPGATSEAAAVAAAESLFPSAGDHYGCGDASGDYTGCALSARLAARLTSLYGKAPYRPLCRCSRAWESVSFRAVGGGTVEVDFQFAPGGAPVTMVVSMIADPAGTGMVADDTSCSGASIYSGPEPPACYMPG